MEVSSDDGEKRRVDACPKALVHVLADSSAKGHEGPPELTCSDTSGHEALGSSGRIHKRNAEEKGLLDSPAKVKLVSHRRLSLEERGELQLPAVPIEKRTQKAASENLSAIITLLLSIFDLIADALSAVSLYQEGDYGWFAVCIFFLLLPLFVLMAVDGGGWRVAVGDILSFGGFKCGSRVHSKDGEGVITRFKFIQTVFEDIPEFLLQLFLALDKWRERSEAPTPWMYLSLAVSLLSLAYAQTLFLDQAKETASPSPAGSTHSELRATPTEDPIRKTASCQRCFWSFVYYCFELNYRFLTVGFIFTLPKYAILAYLSLSIGLRFLVVDTKLSPASFMIFYFAESTLFLQSPAAAVRAFWLVNVEGLIPIFLMLTAGDVVFVMVFVLSLFSKLLLYPSYLAGRCNGAGRVHPLPSLPQPSSTINSGRPSNPIMEKSPKSLQRLSLVIKVGNLPSPPKTARHISQTQIMTIATA